MSTLGHRIEPSVGWGSVLNRFAAPETGSLRRCVDSSVRLTEALGLNWVEVALARLVEAGCGADYGPATPAERVVFAPSATREVWIDIRGVDSKGDSDGLGSKEEDKGGFA